MSKIKELKINNENNLNLIDVIELFGFEKKSKYTETLLRLMKNTKSLREHTEEVKSVLVKNFEFIERKDLDKFNDIQLLLLYRFIDSFFNVSDLISFRKFCEYNERGLIEQNDLTKYKSFEELVSQMSIAEMKAEEKEMESQIIKIYEDTDWILVRPLTHHSSMKYGANTKWCTTQTNSPEYFHKYTKRGVLIYCINKKTGYKVASFYSLDKNDPEFSYWNQKDTRIDSTESELTLELIGFIRDYVKQPKVKTNHFMLDDKSREIEENGGFKRGRVHQLTRRIQDAVRREEVEQQEPMVEEEPQTGGIQTTIDRMQLISGTSTTTNIIFSGATSSNTILTSNTPMTLTTSNTGDAEISIRREE